MPIYELECECGFAEDQLLAGYAQATSQTCPRCGSRMRKLIGRPQVVVLELSAEAIDHAVAVGPDAARQVRDGLAVRRDTNEHINMRPFGRQKLALENNSAIVREIEKVGS